MVLLAILILDKIGFETRKITREKESHFIMTRGSTYQEDITILSVYYTPRTKAPQYIKQKVKELKRKIDYSTVMQILVSILSNGKPTRQKISQDIEGLNNAINQFNLFDIYIYRISHLDNNRIHVFSTANETFSEPFAIL